MRKMIMNVTPAEFKEIDEVWNLSGWSDADAVAFMVSHYGCERFTEYRLVVHLNAPCIPMLSWNLPRFENDRPTTEPKP
jgi:hypothetical protein